MGAALKNLPESQHPDLLAGYTGNEDAGVVRLTEELCLVQSVDFFTPIVDDPFDFGAIAAANALSDIYAMGGEPRTALSLVCYPYKSWPLELLNNILIGGSRKVQEASAMVIGGHSVADEEIKIGYAVTGTIAADRIWRNRGAQVGDRLVLTKPLGTGLLTTAVKKDLLDQSCLEVAVAEMKRLNATAVKLASELEVHAATDVTGYGLLGHLYEMLRGDALGADIHCEALPLFPHVWDAIAHNAFTAAQHTNREYVAEFDLPDTPGLQKFGPVVFDPQTSGGLLLALPPDQAETLVAQLQAAGHHTAVIGRVKARPQIHLLP